MRPPVSNLEFHNPAALLARVEAEMAVVPNTELFNDPAHQPLLDRWCAGSFGIGYLKYVASCKVAMSPPGRGEDFFLFARGRYFSFQTTEVQEPGRRRGLLPTVLERRPPMDRAGLKRGCRKRLASDTLNQEI